MSMAGDVESFRAELDVDVLDTVDAIRAIIAASHSGLTEGIKWNAPSFAIGGDDRITLGLERKGGVRVVMHRGAKPKTLGGFSFEDKDGLARWPAPDRGVVIFQDKVEVEQRAEALRDLCSRWLAATS
jgi:hypothetical protein